MVHIAVLMMVKNETKRLNVSLNSIKDFADSLVIFDTGSTDDTIELIETWVFLYLRSVGTGKCHKCCTNHFLTERSGERDKNRCLGKILQCSSGVLKTR